MLRGLIAAVCFACFFLFSVRSVIVFLSNLCFAIVCFHSILDLGLCLGFAVVLVVVLVVFVSFRLIFGRVTGNLHKWMWPIDTTKTRFM